MELTRWLRGRAAGCVSNADLSQSQEPREGGWRELTTPQVVLGSLSMSHCWKRPLVRQMEVILEDDVPFPNKVCPQG